MTLDALKALAKAMAEAKVLKAEFYDERELSVRLELHESAFAPDPMENVPPEFQTPPSDRELLYRSVEEGDEP